VHTREELDRAIAVNARIIGVNNRDLKTLTVSVETSFDLIEHIPESCIAVSESGLRDRNDLAKLGAAGFDAFLIGEQLMLAHEPGMALAQLLSPRGPG
jgi:indole-3-glycerol phosphate synthase